MSSRLAKSLALLAASLINTCGLFVVGSWWTFLPSAILCVVLSYNLTEDTQK